MKQPTHKVRDRRTILAEMVQQAVQLHLSGRLDEAEVLYKSVLKTDSTHFDAKQLLGELRMRQGRYDDAIKLLRQAIAFNGKVPQVHLNLANAHLAQNAFAEAIASYDKVIALQPDSLDAYARRGNAAKALGQLDLALKSYDAALAIKSDIAEVLNNRAATLLELGRGDEALASARKALSLRPNYPEAHNNCGLIQMEQGQLPDALASYDQALALQPAYPAALYNRGIALMQMKRPLEALTAFREALSLVPDSIDALNNCGAALDALDRPEEALECYDRAIAIAPEFASPHCNRGMALAALHRFHEAIVAYDRALELDPTFEKASFNRSILVMLLGDFADQWADYEHRFEQANVARRELAGSYPHWKGEPLNGKKIIVCEEQGIGDTIQFARYLQLIADRGAEVTFLARASLSRLLRPLAATVRIVDEEPNETFDFQCALLSLPGVFKTTPQNTPQTVPYLAAEPDLVATWQDRLGDKGFKIGICWQGNPLGSIDVGRSIPLRQFQPIAGIDGVRLISLQKNHGLEQLAELPEGMHVETLGPDFDVGPDAFVDTAAVMANLDLIITSDTSVAHLAGALGRPVWLVLKQVPDWRWLLDRADSPWYPTMRLYRQPKRGDWESPFAQIADDLRSHLAAVADGKPTSLAPEAPDDGHPAQTTEQAGGEKTKRRAALILPRDGFNEGAMCRQGPMIFNRYDWYIGSSLRKYGEFSQGEADLFRQIIRPGMVVVEVGANMGAHTVGLSRMTGNSGKVIAFEPQRLIFQTLCANIALNSCRNVFAHQIAVGAENGEIIVPSLPPDVPANFGGVSLEDATEGERVRLIRLDDFGIAECHFLKIDIEGMEVAALHGSTDLIARSRPVIYVENDREEKSAVLTDLLKSWNYTLHDHRPYMFSDKNFANDQENIFPDIISQNLLCLPEEYSAAIVGL